jgi:hypothetical protein
MGILSHTGSGPGASDLLSAGDPVTCKRLEGKTYAHCTFSARTERSTSLIQTWPIEYLRATGCSLPFATEVIMANRGNHLRTFDKEIYRAQCIRKAQNA